MTICYKLIFLFKHELIAIFNEINKNIVFKSPLLPKF